MTWQTWLEQHLPAGTHETSGFRTPRQEAALGGPASSYHSRGSVSAPGAIDVGGPAEQLKLLFDEIQRAFKGRINELYLNLPGGGSEAIKNNQPLGRNPEEGRPQHLHVALGTTVDGPAPAAGIDPHNRGEKAVEAAGGDCVRSLSWTTPAGWAAGALGREAPEGAVKYLCWSDVWVYGAALGLVGVGALMVSRGRG